MVRRDGETTTRDERASGRYTPMNDEEITAKLKPVFERVLEAPDLTLTRQMTANDVEQWDSLRHIQLSDEVERTFSVKFRLREVLKMKNVGDLIDLIHTKTT
jgi:acyl carrier protein